MLTTTESVIPGHYLPLQVVEKMAALEAEVQSLKSQLDWFKKQLFGQKSEKRLVDENPHQASLLAGLESPISPQPEPDLEEITYKRRKGKLRDKSCVTGQGLRFDDSVPVERIELPAPELNSKNQHEYDIIGEKITRRLAQRPGSYVILEYVRPVIKHKPSQQLTTVPAPSAIFDNCMADVSVLVGLLVDKFVYHMPLYRQHQRLKQCGITLSRSTLTQWVQKATELLQPIYDAQLQHMLQSKVLAMDETPIKAGRKKKGKMQSTWYWPIYGEQDELAFTWSSSRATAHIEKQLAGFAGTLLTDGYAAYDCYAKNKPEITQAQCWAHTRRYFIKAEKIEPEAVRQALDYIGALYQFEEQAREQKLNSVDKLKLRCEKSKPIAEQFFAWCHEQQQRTDLVNSNPLARALNYVRSHKESLSVYLGDPDVQIDTNHLERALRVIPMGRKNWMFCWTELGAKHVGIIQSLLATCRLQDVNPYTYLVDVLQRISLHPARDVEALTPRVWKEKFAANPLKSDLET